MRDHYLNQLCLYNHSPLDEVAAKASALNYILILFSFNPNLLLLIFVHETKLLNSELFSGQLSCDIDIILFLLTVWVKIFVVGLGLLDRKRLDCTGIGIRESCVCVCISAVSFSSLVEVL